MTEWISEEDENPGIGGAQQTLAEGAETPWAEAQVGSLTGSWHFFIHGLRL